MRIPFSVASVSTVSEFRVSRRVFLHDFLLFGVYVLVDSRPMIYDGRCCFEYAR